MIEIGVREFKRDLSAYLKRAQAGELIRITSHGRPIVELSPARVMDDEEARIEAQVAELEATGRLVRSKVPIGERRRVDPTKYRFKRSPSEVLREEQGSDPR